MPAPTRAGRARTVHDRPLACSRCKAAGSLLRVERGQNSRRIRGKRRTAVNVECRRCGHEWFSVNTRAVALATQADAEARG